MVSTGRNKIFFEYWSHSNSNNGLKENMNEIISSQLNRKFTATGPNKLIKNLFKIYFYEMEKLLLKRIFEELEQYGFH